MRRQRSQPQPRSFCQLLAHTRTSLATDIKHNLALISRAVTLLEPRFTTRALRSLPALRKKLGAKGEFLAEVVRSGAIYPDSEYIHTFKMPCLHLLDHYELYRRRGSCTNAC